VKPKLESAYLSVENMERALEFFDWFLKRKAIKKGRSLNMYDIDGFRLFLFDHAKENENVRYGDNCLLSFEVEDVKKQRTNWSGEVVKLFFH